MDPLVVIGACLLAGGVAPFAPGEVLVAGAVMAAMARLTRRRSGWLIGAAVLATVLGAARAVGAVRAHDALRLAADERLPRALRCTGVVRVTTSPVRTRGALKWEGELRDADCEGTPWTGMVTLYGGPSALARGDELAVVADLAPPNRLWNDGDPRPREARMRTVRTGSAIVLRVLALGKGMLPAIDRARAHVRARIDETFPDDVAPMARALVLGESDLAPEDDSALRMSGLSHLLAVSGMHLVIAVVGAVTALRGLLTQWVALAARIDVGRVVASLGVPLAWAYAEAAGGGGATRRAACALSISFVARALGRKADAVRSFGGALVLMALADPLGAFDVSLLLSAAATAGLLVFAQPLAAALGRSPGRPSLLARSVAATIAATIPCAPILARFAPALPLAGVVANLIAVPVGESVAHPLCLGHALLGPWPAAERGCALAATGALRIVRLVAVRFAGLQLLQIHVPSPTSWQLATLVVAFAGFIVVDRRWRLPLGCLVAASLLVAEVDARRRGHPQGIVRVTFLDVGQGDAALVDLPDGGSALIDGGGLVGSPIDVGARVLVPLLRARRRDGLTLALLTHPHPDHFGGFATGLAGVSLGAFWDTGQGERERVGGAYATVLADLRRRGVPVVGPPAFCGSHAIGGATFDVLAPCPASRFDRDPNDNSIAVRLSFGERAILFVGDAEREEENDLLRLDPARLRADVLKVGHHGSSTSSSPPFLAAVSPREAVISVGARNRFGHPSPGTLSSLTRVGARVWRTDRDGAVTVTTDGHALRVDVGRMSF